MIFIYKITEVKFCISLRKYRDETLAANDVSAYTQCSQSHRKLISNDSYATQIFTN